jgi:hypothetical protein
MTKHPRFWRAFRLGGLVILVLLLLLGGVGWWAESHLAGLIVGSVNRAYPGLTLSANAAVFSPPNELRLEAVRLCLRSDHSEVLRLPAARVRFSWWELRRHFIREIVIEHPSIRITDQLLAALPARSTNELHSSRDIPWRVGSLSISGGSCNLDVAPAPLVQFQFAADISDGASRADATHHQVRLTAVRARLRGEIADAVSIPALTVTFSPDELRRGIVRELVVKSPSVVLNDPLLAIIPKQTATGATATAWRIESLSIEKGAARVDLSAYPRAQFDFSAHFSDADHLGNAPLALDLGNISVHLQSAPDEVLSIASARVVASMEGLRERKIREITIEDLHASVADAAIEQIRSAAAPPAASPSAEPASTPWTLQRVSVKRARAIVDLRGAPLAEFGFALQMADAIISPDAAGDLQALEVSDLALRSRDKAFEPFLRVPMIRAEFRIPELLREGRLARLRVERLDFRYNSNFREMIASGDEPALANIPSSTRDSAANPVRPFTIGELRLTESRVHLNDLGLGVPPIEFPVETTLHDLVLTPGGGPAGQDLQTVELSQVALSSPLDPFFSVLKLDSLFIRFTLAGLWRREIEQVAIVHPILAVGPDLFWYIDRMEQNAAAVPAPVAAVQDTGPAWSIRHFDATSGQFVLALEGQHKLAAPMPFESHAENLNFRRLSDLRLKLAIEMPEQDYQYPGYELTLHGVRGRVEFSLPPETRANNVVNTLHIREVRWKNFRGRDFFLDVTYDARGIYGNLGGKAYTGLLNGQFNFLLSSDSPWNGWISGEHIDLKPVTDALAPEKFSLNGPADFRMSVTARATEFDSVIGDFAATRSGQLRITKLDDVIRSLPGDWSGLKRGLARIGLETLRDFAYDAAHGDFRFHGLSGVLHLDLRGARGSRKIAVEVHDDASPPPASRVVARRP